MALLAILALGTCPASADPCRAAYRKLQSAPRYTGRGDRGPICSSGALRPNPVLPKSAREQIAADSRHRKCTSVLTAVLPLIHIAKDSPNPQLPSNYDIVAYFETLKGRTFASAMEFYSELAQAVRGLSDGATQIVVRSAPVYT